MRECYISKVLSKPPCLIAKIKFEKSVQLLKVRKRKTQEVQSLFASVYDLISKGATFLQNQLPIAFVIMD